MVRFRDLLLLFVLAPVAVFAQSINVQTKSYTLQASDNGMLVEMNCSLACTLTLPAPPSASFRASVLSIGAVTPTIALGGRNFNGAAVAPAVSTSLKHSEIYTDGSNWFGDDWGTDASRVINGVAYSALYPQTTFEQRVNACITDAEKGANGATAHICNSFGDGSVIHSTITVGDSSSDQVTWILPPSCGWNFWGPGFGATAVGILQYDNTNIEADGSVYGCLIKNTTANGGIYALYATALGASYSAGNYIKMSGVAFQNGTYTSPVTTASGHDVIMQYLTDGSEFKDISLTDYAAGQIPWQVGGNFGSGVGSPCCTVIAQNIVVNGMYRTAGIMQITASGVNGAANLFTCLNCSLDHPAPGSPSITCIGSTGTEQVHVAFDHLYEEVMYNSASDIGPANVSGTPGSANACGYISVHDEEIKNEGTYPTSQPLWQLNGTSPASLLIEGSSSPFTFKTPAIVVQNNIPASCSSVPCNAVADANGVLAIYTTSPIYVNTVGLSH